MLLAFIVGWAFGVISIIALALLLTYREDRRIAWLQRHYYCAGLKPGEREIPEKAYEVYPEWARGMNPEPWQPFFFWYKGESPCSIQCSTTTTQPA